MSRHTSLFEIIPHTQDIPIYTLANKGFCRRFTLDYPNCLIFVFHQVSFHSRVVSYLFCFLQHMLCFQSVICQFQYFFTEWCWQESDTNLEVNIFVQSVLYKFSHLLRYFLADVCLSVYVRNLSFKCKKTICLFLHKSTKYSRHVSVHNAGSRSRLGARVILSMSHVTVENLHCLSGGWRGSTEVKILKDILDQLILEGRYTPVRIPTPSSYNLDYTEAMVTR